MEIRQLHTEILDEKRKQMLQAVTEHLPASAYLAGGTSLSLQRGYRVSVDFVFFTPDSFNAWQTADSLRESGYSLQENSLSDGTCDVLLDSVQVSLFRYRYPMLKTVHTSSEYPLLRLASIEDIAAMKLIAIGQRGARKDFYDLYEIIQDEHYSASDLVRLVKIKYQSVHSLAHIGMGLSYFEDAEQQVLGKVFREEDWGKMKKYFTRLSDNVMKELRA